MDDDDDILWCTLGTMIPKLNPLKVKDELGVDRLSVKQNKGKGIFKIPLC